MTWLKCGAYVLERAPRTYANGWFRNSRKKVGISHEPSVLVRTENSQSSDIERLPCIASSITVVDAVVRCRPPRAVRTTRLVCGSPRSIGPGRSGDVNERS